VSASPDGRWIATGGDYSDARVRIWEVGTWRLARTLEQKGGVYAMAFSPDSGHLATASYDPVSQKDADIRVWRIGPENYGGIPVTEVSRTTSPSRVIELRYSPDGRRLIALGEEGVLSAWRLPSRAARTQSPAGLACAISADGATGAIAAAQYEVGLVQLPSFNRLGQVSLDTEVVDLALSRNGRWIAVLTREVDEAREAERKRAQEAMRRQFGFPAETHLNQAPTHYRYFIHLSGTAGNDTAAIFELAERPYLVVVSDDGRWVAAAGADGTRTVYLFDVTGGRQPGALVHDSDVTSLAFHPNNAWLITGDGGRLSVSGRAAAHVWDLRSGRELHRVDHDGSVVALALARSGRAVASADMGGSVVVWAPDSGVEYARVSDAAAAVAFSPDETLLATASGASGVNLWNSDRGQLITRAGHGDAGYARDDAVVGFSPDGRWLASARPDDTARVWDVETLKEVARLEFEGSEIWVDDMHIDPQRGFFALCGSLGTFDSRSPTMGRTLEVWDWQPEQMVRRACARLTRDLTETEWVRYMGGEPHRPVCPD
jgi:WD40 repeat protein